jgi:transposase
MLNALKTLPEDPAELRQVSELLIAEVKTLTLKVEQLQHQLHGANRHRFGSKSESLDQLQLFTENEEIGEAAVEVAGATPCEAFEPKEKPKRKPLPDHLDRIEQVLSVGEDCAKCGGDLKKLGEDVTEELGIHPRLLCRKQDHSPAHGLLPLRGHITSAAAIAPDRTGSPRPRPAGACVGQQVRRSLAALPPEPNLCP